MTNPAPWLHLIGTLDVIIDAVGGTADICSISASILSSFSTIAKNLRLASAPKLTYIYSSGTWVQPQGHQQHYSLHQRCSNGCLACGPRATRHYQCKPKRHHHTPGHSVVLDPCLFSIQICFGRKGGLVRNSRWMIICGPHGRFGGFV